MIDPSTARVGKVQGRSSGRRHRARCAAVLGRGRRGPARSGDGGWCGRSSLGWRAVRNHCRAPARGSHGRHDPVRHPTAMAAPGMGRRELGTLGHPISAANSTHNRSIREAGSRGTDSPGDHQDFSNPMITCRSVPLPATTHRHLDCRTLLGGGQPVYLGEQCGDLADHAEVLLGIGLGGGALGLFPALVQTPVDGGGE